MNASSRDVASEANAWRGNVRHPLLAAMIVNLHDDDLARAHLTWWETYSRCIRNAPSNRIGISSADAAEASETANRAVRELLTNSEGVSS